MSLPVQLEQLRAAIEERGGSAYVLTTGEDRPHAVHAPVRWEDGVLTVTVGKRTAANVAARPAVSLLYPVRTDGDYSLIVDGTAVVASHADGHELRITPTKAVMHRPAAAPGPTAPCSADCVPLLLPLTGSTRT